MPSSAAFLVRTDLRSTGRHASSASCNFGYLFSLPVTYGSVYESWKVSLRMRTDQLIQCSLPTIHLLMLIHYHLRCLQA